MYRVLLHRAERTVRMPFMWSPDFSNSGTIMHKTKLPLLVWFWAIYLVAHDKRGRSALSVAQILNLNYRTSWRLLHKIRSSMSQRDTGYQLAGIVEMEIASLRDPPLFPMVIHPTNTYRNWDTHMCRRTTTNPIQKSFSNGCTS